MKMISITIFLWFMGMVLIPMIFGNGTDRELMISYFSSVYSLAIWHICKLELNAQDRQEQFERELHNGKI